MKIVQYVAVCINEYTLVRHLNRFLKNQIDVKDWSARFKAFGSSISTIRMVKIQSMSFILGSKIDARFIDGQGFLIIQEERRL